MSPRRDCDRARRRLAASLGGEPPPGLAAHLAACPDCRAEAAALTAVIEAAAASPDREVPDPGDAYWEGFLPAVRARIASRGQTVPVRARLARVAAAAVLLAGAALVSLTGGLPPRPDPARRLENDLARLVREASRVSVALDDPGILEVEVERRPEPEELLRALTNISPPSGGDIWNDPELNGLLDRLDADAMRALKADLSARQG